MGHSNRYPAACFGLTILLALAACDTGQPQAQPQGQDEGQPQGRYYSVVPKGLWIEFRNGTVVYGDTGDVSSYQVDGTKITVSDPAGSVEGEIVGVDTVRFRGGTGNLADVFAGVWVARADSGQVLEGEEAQESAEAIVGQWRIPGETSVFDFEPDGTYTWGPRLSGSYEMLAGQRIRVTTVEDGRSLGSLDYDYAVDGSRLSLTFPDGSTMTYERVE